MRTIGIVTVARSDYGIYQPLLRALREAPGFQTWLFVTGAHLEERFGYTVRDIESDGFEIRERVPLDLQGDDGVSVAAAMGRGVSGFATALARSRPDILVVLGDRFDMIPAAMAALPLRIPVAHIHGGEITEGAMDESIRHAITKLSHLHFPSTEAYAANLRQMGEEPWRITVSGAPSLDNLAAVPRLSREALSARVGLDVKEPLLVTYHPATLTSLAPTAQIEELLAGLDAWPGQVVFTGVNMDPGNRAIRNAIEAWVTRRRDAALVENLGTAGYFSLMGLSQAMVGNSSSGIIEAASFKLPVVNVGNRQQGRLHDRNVIDVACTRADIAAAIHRATSPQFRASLQSLVNPYGDGQAAPRILERLAGAVLDEQLITKRFCRQADGASQPSLHTQPV